MYAGFAGAIACREKITIFISVLDLITLNSVIPALGPESLEHDL